MTNSKPVASFKPGDPRINRNGRPPKEWTWSGLIKEKMEEVGPDKKAVKDAVASALLGKALGGDVVAIKEVGNRIEGLPKQYVEQLSEVRLYSNLSDEKLDEIIRQKSKEAGVADPLGGEEKAD